MKNVITGWFLAFVLGSAGAQPLLPASWRPSTEKIGWWVYELQRGVLVIGMKNEGLLFHAHVICPIGSPYRVAETVWYGGDEVSRFAIDCDGNFGLEDVRFHLEPEFFGRLPILPRLQLFEAMYPSPDRP